MNRSHFWFDDLPPIKSYQYALIPHSFLKGKLPPSFPFTPPTLLFLSPPPAPRVLYYFGALINATQS